MNFDNEHAGRTSTWHPSPGGEKGKRHVEDQQARVEALQSEVRSLGVLVPNAAGRRWRTAVAAVCRRLSCLILLATVAAGAPGFTLRFGEIGPLEPITPALDHSPSLQFIELVYEPLLVPDETGELSPWLARSWQLLPNGNVYVEPNLDRYFSDGSPVTLQDIADSLIAFGLDPAPAGAGLEIASGTTGLRPELMIPRTPIFKTVSGGYLGTGPFTIVTQDRDLIVMQRTFHVPHRIDRVEIVGYPTYRDMLLALLRGDCNGTTAIKREYAEILEDLHRFHIIPDPPVRKQAVIFKHNVFSPKERHVLLRYLQESDLEYIVGVGPRRSTSILKPLALNPGPRINVLRWDDDRLSRRLALAVRRLLGRRGGEILDLPMQEAWTAFREGRFGLFVDTVLVWPEAQSLAYWHSGGLYAPTGYSNPALDAALDAGDWKAARRAFDLDPPGLLIADWPRFTVLDQQILNPTLGWYIPFETLPSWEVP